MPGPAPKHPSRRTRRNNPAAGFSTLPAEGRTKPAPEWPLGPDVAMSAQVSLMEDKLAELAAQIDGEGDGRKKGRMQRQSDQLQMSLGVMRLRLEQSLDAEVELWELLWTTPQATMWDESSAFARMVAQFVRWNVRAEGGDLKAAVEARLRGQELGLSPLSLQKLRKEIEEARSAEDRGSKRRSPDSPVAEVKSDDKPEDPRGLFFVS